jgi:fluoroquinolone transport system permease protein
MFKRVLLHELRSITRDKMYAFLMIYPIVIAFISYFLIPYIRDLNLLAANIVIIFFILMNGFMFGAITGFTLLDDQDDHVILSLKITPISVKSYIFFKLLVSYLLGILATLLLLIVSNMISEFNLDSIIYIVILSPLHGPIIALLINSIASNKVEGFVIMKLSGIILMVPIAALFLTDWKEIFLMIIPGFWTTRIISMELIQTQYFLDNKLFYFILGLLVNGLVMALLFKLYTRRIKI